MTDINFRKLSDSSILEANGLNEATRSRASSSNVNNEYDTHGSRSFDNARLYLQGEQSNSKQNSAKCRNLVGFWLLGLCNNYAYVIMLSAAFDILKEENHANNTSSNQTNGTIDIPTSICNPTSTGAILLADVLPSLSIKLIAPFFIPGKHFRVVAVVLLSSLSFLLTSLSVAKWMSFLGVICAAFSSGLGEVTFLSLSSHFDKNVVSMWSSGTGGAGVFGSLSYAGLTTAGVSPRTTLQIMLIMPILLALSFWVLIVHPPATKIKLKRNLSESQESVVQRVEESVQTDPIITFSLKEKLTLTRPLLKYMIPLSLVYFAEYFINQGLQEIIYFEGIWLTHEEQYRWYQVDYQIGVMISRSSVNILKINRLWILPILQFINAIFLFCVAYFKFLPSIWIVLCIVLYEGLLGGAAYVNTFYKISEEIPKPHREISMGIASLGDSFGIALAGGVAIPVHDALCKLPL